jgi:exopolysaccharide biosynthesis polyprenyl glycosylphosphotransferase
MLVSLIFALATHQRFSSYYIFYGSLFFAVVYVSVLRYAYLRVSGFLLGRAGYRRRALIVGSADRLQHVAHGLRRDVAASPVDVVGSISDDGMAGDEVPSLGTVEDLPRVLGRHRIQEVIIADPDMPEQRAIELVDQCHERGVTVHLAPSTIEILISRAEFVPGQTVPLFTLKPPVFDGVDFALKRAFDLVGASLLLILLSPVLASIALAVRLSSRGPVLYRSARPGMGGAAFACLKFRTMSSNAAQAQDDLEPLNEASGALFKIRSDPRLTRVGRFLRRFSLDELPQLWNVLRGEMSLVGPRPLPLRDFERLDDWHKKRYLVLPGITGLWQVSGRSELDFDDLVRLDFLYLERWSVFLDLTILLKTVPAVLSRRGAF